MHEDFSFDERDFVLAEGNETRKIWAEKFLGIAPSRAEAEHFALYHFYASALTESFKRQAGASFVSGRSFDPFLESRNVLKRLLLEARSWRNDRRPCIEERTVWHRRSRARKKKWAPRSSSPCNVARAGKKQARLFDSRFDVFVMV